MGRVVRCFAVFVALSATVSGAGDSPLVAAVKRGDVAAVRAQIRAKTDVDVRAGDGSTPLLWAVYHSHLDVVRALVDAKADVSAANAFGITPLLQASRTGDAAIMAVLLKAGADPARAHPDGETPLVAAARTGSLPAVQLLLEQRVDVNAADRVQQTTALMYAAAEGHTDVVGLLLEAGADPNRQGHVTAIAERTINADHPTGGFSALMWAARNGHEETARRLVAGGASLTATNGDRASAAMIAIYNDRFDLGTELITLGSDANDGSLYLAVEMRESTTDQFAFDGSRLRPNHPNQSTALDLIRLLLERGADPNKPFTGQLHSSSMPNSDRFDNTPFFRAAVAADVEALKLLIAHGANLEQTPAVPPPVPVGDEPAPAGARGRPHPHAGKTAAMASVTGGRGPQMTGGPGYIRSGPVPYREPGSRKPEEALALLLKAGANPNAKAPDGSTLLHQAAQTGNLAMVRALAEAKVDFTQTNRDGLTALDVAEGKRPPDDPAAAAGATPAAAGAAGRGRGSAAKPEVAELLRELMGLPALPSPAADAASATLSSAVGQGSAQ